MLVKPSILKFCSLFLVSILAFSLVLNTLNTDYPITGFVVGDEQNADEAAADGPQDAPVEEGEHPGFAPCRSLPEGTAMEMVFNCEESEDDYNNCEHVIGHVFKFTPQDELLEEPCALEFPPEEAGYDGNVYPREIISCANPNAVTLAKYENDKWVPISSIVESPEGGSAGVKVTATVNKLGVYAVIKRTNDYIPIEDQGRVAACTEFSCFGLNEGEQDYARIFKATYTDKQQAKAGDNVQLFSCGMIDGCFALQEGLMNRTCPPGIDPDISTIDCKPDEIDCCIPARDGFCDQDCWKKPALVDGVPLTTTITNENGEQIEVQVAEDSTDPDCLEQGVKDALAGLRIETKTEEYTINLFRDVDNSQKEWQLIEIPFDYPVVLSDDIDFSVSGGYVWFKDFTYVDINGKEHKLYPQKQLGSDWLYGNGQDGGDKDSKFCDNCVEWLDDEGENRPLEGTGPAPRSELEGEHETIRHFDDYDPPFGDDNDQETDRSYWNYLFFHPYVWYQREPRLGVFKIPNITVQKIKYWALADEYSETPPAISFTYHFFNINSDTDKDNFGAETDCNDNNPNIKPGRNEPAGCDGIDNNCNEELFWQDDKEHAYFSQRISWKGSGDDNKFWNNKNMLAPCNGYIQITEKERIAYLELWKYRDFVPTNEEELSYLPTVRALSRYIETEEEESMPYLKSPIWNGELWQDYQKVFAYYEQSDLEAETDEEGPPSACGSIDDGGECIVGSKGSCGIGQEPLNCDGAEVEAYSSWNRDGGVHADNDKIDIRKGDLIWGAVLPDEVGGVENDGKLEFEIWCYPEIPPTNELKQYYVDEGINCETEQQEQRTVNFCKSDAFDYGNRRCFEENSLCPPFATKTDGGSCQSQISESQEPGIIDYFVFVCPDDREKECYKYTEGMFKVCAAKESCNPAANLDLDCDGLKPYATREDGSVDTSKPLDPDCIGTCAPDTCDPVNKQWCNLGQWDINNYCQKCGPQDSSCGKACAEGERSCQGGCLPNVCDVSDNKWCNEGYWDTGDYATKCGKDDSEFYAQANNDCTHRGCDIAADKICFPAVNVWSWGVGEIGREYCETGCNLVDSSCNRACTPGTCDVDAEKYCDSNGNWIQSDNYCDSCGAFDADCGVDICQEGTCDYGSHKVCINKKWVQPADYCARCAQSEIATGYCACTPTAGQEEAETSCTDRQDNDCDGVADCADPDCPSDLPECTCIEGTTQTCGVTQGLCVAGTQTCSNGAWGECAGEVKPKTETCNSFDDDCDGNTDEGCGSCLAGETRQCGADRGLCTGGLQVCAEATGLWSTCSGPVYRTIAQENCDGQDNNCDGKIDEGCGCIEGNNQTCGVNLGICKPGMQTCSAGRWSDCIGVKDKLPEVCNDGLDNDCDGLIDSADDSCKASASLSPTCYDAIQNQEEEGTDCGGPCEDCDRASCNDRQKNGDEDGLDCGGSKCPPCGGAEEKLEEKCGNDVCEDNEDSDSCPEDCPPVAAKPKKEKKGFPLGTLVISIIALGILAIFAMAFLKSKKTGQPILEVIKSMFKKKQIYQPVQKPLQKATTLAQKPVSQQPSRQPFQKRKSLEEEQLEKSFKEASEMFKK